MLRLQILLAFLSQTMAANSVELHLKKIADLPEKLYETSGLAISGKYIVTHNDSGNKPEIYLLNHDGEIVRTIEVEDAKNHDWEDIAADTKGRIYIGDVGNNLNSRELLRIYILPNDFSDHQSVEPEVIEFTYEDQRDFPPKEEELYFDCEGFICAGDKIYIFSKCRTKPFTGISRVYELSQNPGTQVAKKIGEIQLCKSGWQFCSITAADYHEATKTLVLLTYSRLYILKDFRPSAPEKWNGNLKSYQLPAIKQREAICFKSATEWYITDEYRRGLGGGNLYKAYLE